MLGCSLILLLLPIISCTDFAGEKQFPVFNKNTYSRTDYRKTFKKLCKLEMSFIATQVNAIRKKKLINPDETLKVFPLKYLVLFPECLTTTMVHSSYCILLIVKRKTSTKRSTCVYLEDYGKRNTNLRIKRNLQKEHCTIS